MDLRTDVYYTYAEEDEDFDWESPSKQLEMEEATLVMNDRNWPWGPVSAQTQWTPTQSFTSHQVSGSPMVQWPSAARDPFYSHAFSGSSAASFQPPAPFHSTLNSQVPLMMMAPAQSSPNNQNAIVSPHSIYQATPTQAPAKKSKKKNKSSDKPARQWLHQQDPSMITDANEKARVERAKKNRAYRDKVKARLGCKVCLEMCKGNTKTLEIVKQLMSHHHLSGGFELQG